MDARAAPERDVRDAALLRMLSDAHEDFVLVHGTLQSVLSDERVRANSRGGVGRADGARRRLAPFVAALGANVAFLTPPTTTSAFAKNPFGLRSGTLERVPLERVP